MADPAVITPEHTRDMAWIGGSVHHIALDAEKTGGRLTVVRAMLRAGSASPVHVHPDEDETLILTTGELAVWAGDRRWNVGVGDTVFLPRGVPHGYRSLADADLITICTPSGMERFYERAGWDLAHGAPPEDWSVTQEALAEAAQLGGQVVLGPPLEEGQEMPRHLRSWSRSGADPDPLAE